MAWITRRPGGHGVGKVPVTPGAGRYHRRQWNRPAIPRLTAPGVLRVPRVPGRRAPEAAPSPALSPAAPPGPSRVGRPTSVSRTTIHGTGRHPGSSSSAAPGRPAHPAGRGRLAEFESGRREHIVLGPRLGRRGKRLAHRRRVPEPRLGGLRAMVRPWHGPVAGLGRRRPAGCARRPGAALELEPGRGPAPRIIVGLTVAGRHARDGPGDRPGEGVASGTRRPGTRGTRRTPGAVSRGMASRFPCHLCLAVDRMGPGEMRSQRGLNRGKPCAIAADRTGRHRA